MIVHGPQSLNFEADTYPHRQRHVDDHKHHAGLIDMEYLVSSSGVGATLGTRIADISTIAVLLILSSGGTLASSSFPFGSGLSPD